MRMWNHYAPAKEWHRWVQYTSTEEDQLAKVIRRSHRERFSHNTCPYSECDQHPEPLVLAHDINN